MRPIDYVRFVRNQVLRRPINKEKQLEVIHELTDMVRDGMTIKDIRFTVNVKYGTLFKSNNIEY